MLRTTAAAFAVICVAFSNVCFAQKDCNVTLDAIFLLDGSDSIHKFIYDEMVSELLQALPSFTMGPGHTRIGVIMFGTAEYMKVIPLTDDISQLSARIQANREWPDGTTETDKALEQAMSQLMTSGRAGVPKVIVVMTDGLSNDGGRTETAAAEIKRRNITILTVGMSGEDNSTELAMMATEKSRDVYRFRDFTLLIQRMVGMAKVVCYDCQSGIDLMFVLDGSSSVHIINYLRTLVAMKKAIFSFLDDYSNSRIGLITYASGIQDVMPPTNDKTVFSAITKMGYPNGGTTTAQAVAEATRQLQQNQRKGIPSVIVVITDGASEDPAATLAAARRAKDLGFTVYTIGVGQKIDLLELDQMASSSSQAYVVQDFTALTSQLTLLVKTVCSDKCSRTVDVMFLVDSSNDVGVSNFQVVTSAVSRVAQYFLNGSDSSRVDVITYSTNVIQNLGLRSDVSVFNDIKNLWYVSGTRTSSLALQQAAQTVLSNKRNGVPFVVVVLIAGPSNDPASAAVWAQLLVSQSGASAVYVLEMTSAVSAAETKAMTGNIDGRIFHGDSYSQVNTQLSAMAAAICEAP